MEIVFESFKDHTGSSPSFDNPHGWKQEELSKLYQKLSETYNMASSVKLNDGLRLQRWAACRVVLVADLVGRDVDTNGFRIPGKRPARQESDVCNLERPWGSQGPCRGDARANGVRGCDREGVSGSVR